MPLYVGHLIGTNHHTVMPVFEGVDEALNGRLVVVGIVGIELDSILATARVVYRHIPVAADGVPCLVLRDVYQFGCTRVCLTAFDIVLHTLANQLLCAVGGVVVHDENIVGIGCMYCLTQCALYGVLYGAHAILARNNHTGSYTVCLMGELS